MGYTEKVENINAYAAKGFNPLHMYASFNCLFTLACLTREQQAARSILPSSVKNIIASSKGDWGKNNKHVSTEFGSFDYFIDDVLIVSVPTLSQPTGNSLATKISFKITEPYSMGLFYLALQAGAKASDYDNYREAPFLLMIEFAGYGDDGMPRINSNLTRFIPIKFIKSKMKVTASGSVYECEAIPYNEITFRDEFANIRTEGTLRGSTVETLLRTGEGSLQTMLAKQIQETIKEKGADFSDQYEIHFPKDFTDPNNSGNAISSSKVFTDFTDAGAIKFPNTDEIYDVNGQFYQNKRVQITTDKSFHFERNMKIQEVITEVVLRSDYITKQLTNSSLILNNKGMVNWFRIEANVIDGPYSKINNRQTRKMIYRVLPYEVHISKLIPPNSVPPGYTEIKKTVVRVYDYIYTGKNLDILNLELDFNMAFFSSIPSDGGNRAPTDNPNVTADAKGKEAVVSPTTGSKKLTGADSVTTALTADPNNLKNTGTSSGSDNTSTVQVRILQNLLTNPADLIRINMTILGDPYYLPSSGMGNQIVDPATGPGKDNLLKDGSMNYQNGELDIVVNFRTPIDLDPVTGLYKFSTDVDQFSGLYLLYKIEHKFSQNKFTQNISAVRRRAQLAGSTDKNILLS